MAQVKIYGMRSALRPRQQEVGAAIHGALTAVFQLPADKRFQRFFYLEPDEFLYPADRSERYTIIEVSCFEGRSVEAKKQLIRELFERLQTIGIPPQDVEITITETPKHNWGIRGAPGDELSLGYKVDV
ncbi:MAG: tautomerase family protein [Chloroflexi bacterium]|nr:MAG: tautomerase family protein [Chloroflexota bacterium]